MDGIKLQKMRVHRGITHRIVYESDLCAALQERTKGEFADAAKAIESVCGHY
jgi:hypothetical protein